MTAYELYARLASRAADRLRAHHVNPTRELVKDLADLALDAFLLGGNQRDQTIRLCRRHGLEPAGTTEPTPTDWGEATF